MKAAELERFHEYIRQLRKTVPTRFPAHVRRVVVPDGDYADTALVKRPQWHFRIKVAPEQCPRCHIDALIHEWAHALAWSEGHPVLTDHDEVWGIAFSRAYRAIFPDV